MNAIKLYLGLDVHKDSITLAIAPAGRTGEIRLFGTISNDLHALEKALARLRQAHPAARLEVAYEAGPCGFGLARRLKQLGIPCLVAAPSLIPKAPGAPFKTDKRDARSLARLLRAGELTGVCVPESTDEAIRDLCRAHPDPLPPASGPERETFGGRPGGATLPQLVSIAAWRDRSSPHQKVFITKNAEDAEIFRQDKQDWPDEAMGSEDGGLPGNRETSNIEHSRCFVETIKG